ncbi:MAG: family 16 glycosylhydrolase [Bacteroidales bacterium]|nr:family 16 glycosylhydrolase [Bacteroidales bacterium]
MKNKFWYNSLLPVNILAILVVLLELLLALVLFAGMLFAAGYIAYKGITSYNLILVFLIFGFVIMSIAFSLKKGKTLLLTISVVIITSVIIYNSMSQSNKGNIIEQSNNFYSQKGMNSFIENFGNSSLNNWTIQKYSFQENGCDMSDSQIELNNSKLVITVDHNTKKKGKPFIGGEIGSRYSFLYGKFQVSMKNNIAKGTVSSFFLMNKWHPNDWEHKEIDMEFLGKDLNAVQFTVHYFEKGGRIHNYKKYTHNLEFNSAEDYHIYGILWTKDSITWLVDNKPVHTENEILINEPMNIRMNHWAALPYNNDSIINWMGKVDKSKLPSQVFYDYVEYFPLNIK